MRGTWVAFGFGCAAVLAIGHPRGQELANVPADQWPNYQHKSNFSPLTQITPENVSRLTHAWTFNYGAGSLETYPFVSLDYRFQVQPLLVDGVMYISTPSGGDRALDLPSTVTALVPETGEVLWRYESPRNVHGRGLAYWAGNGTVGPRLFYGTDKGYLAALDVATGQPAEGFGADGEVDVYVGVVSELVGESRRETYTVPNPVTVFRDLIIAGARPGERDPPQPRGDIRAWDAVTGALVWEFHVIPQPEDRNHETWPGDSWRNRSGCNVWSSLTADESTGLVFGATGDANKEAPGTNLYCNSILALDGDTGELRWYHQLIHHDDNNWDMPVPPLLIDVERDGDVVPAVLQTGKTRFMFIFDRVTGEPVFGMEERPVMGAAQDEHVWPTQPQPLKPPPVGRMSMTRADLNTMTPEIGRHCAELWDREGYVDSTPYAVSTPEQPVLRVGGAVGGWGPMSYNADLGYVFVNVTDSTGGNAFAYTLPSGATVPCVAPPYGALAAVDVNNGEIAWRVPLGRNESLAELGEEGLNAGVHSIGGSIATASGLVFIGATVDRRFRAFDARTGEELWVTELPANAHATPITYMGRDGAQYVVVAAAGGGPAAREQAVSDALIAFRLPQ